MPVLHWINDADARRAASQVPFHLLERKAEYGDPNQAKKNLIVHGDNLVALKALLPFYKGKVKCIYIDPPYNTGSAFVHYDDNLEHSQWLSMMMPRLQVLREFLTPDGTIWVSINDDEHAYLKILLDEVFGRSNSINIISVNCKNIAGASGGGEDKKLKKNCEHLFVYAKDYKEFRGFNPVFVYKPIAEMVKEYEESEKSWKYTNVLFKSGEKIYLGSTTDGAGDEIKVYRRVGYEIRSVAQLAKSLNCREEDVYNKFGMFIFQTTNAQTSIRTRIIEFRKQRGLHDDLLSIEYVPRSGRRKGQVYEQFYKGDQCRLFAWLRDTAEVVNGRLLKKDRLGSYWDLNPWMKNLTKEGSVLFANSKKPEKLIQNVIEMATSTGDLVLDSFLGSGTTAAVSHKMGRRYIGIEMGEHALTHCVPRMQKVLEGEQGGISESVNWQGGGGFSFYELSNPVFDKYGAINPQVTFETLAAYVWQSETGCAGTPEKKPLLGVKEGIGIYLLYNGVLGDKRPEAGNVLTPDLLESLLAQYPHDGPKVIYAEAMIGIDDLELCEMQI